jgi:RNA polymerase sigma factor (sigma-70 family)
VRWPFSLITSAYEIEFTPFVIFILFDACSMEDKKPHPDQKYVEALLANDHDLISEIYKKFSRKVISFIEKNNGDSDDARDIIQETLITMYQQAREQKLVLTCPFEAYFLLLCKRKWLNKLKSKKGVTIDEAIISIHDDSAVMADDTENFELKNRLFEAKFNELGDKCRELLKLSFTLPSMEDVASALNVSYGYVRKKKSLCMGQLTELIQQSSIYKTLRDH